MLHIWAFCRIFSLWPACEQKCSWRHWQRHKECFR